MKTWVYTKPTYGKDKPGYVYFSEDLRPKLIWVGDVPHLLRAGDMIQVVEGFCVETVDYVYYDLNEDSQEVHLVTMDSGNEYEECEEAD